MAYVPDELRAALVTQLGRVKALSRQLGKVTPWLFPHLEGPHAGDRIVDPRKAWATACRRAGKPGLRLHDLRRSAVRNFEQAGVPRSVATKITGHKTEAVYRRYAITSDADLRDAVSRLESRRSVVAGNPAGKYGLKRRRLTRSMCRTPRTGPRAPGRVSRVVSEEISPRSPCSPRNRRGTAESSRRGAQARRAA